LNNRNKIEAVFIDRDSGGVMPIEEVERVYHTNQYGIADGKIIEFDFEKN